MSYYSGWDETYYRAKELFENAKWFNDGRDKAQALKDAINKTYALPDSYPEKDKLIYDIEHYAYKCHIDLDEISGYY